MPSANAPKEAPKIPLGECRSRQRLPPSEPLKGPRIVLIRPVVLRHRPGRGLRPVLATDAAHGIPLWTRRLPWQGACREHLVQLQVESLRDPGVLVVGHPDQTDLTQVASGKADWNVITHLPASSTASSSVTNRQ
jgi:hypothetical protein